MSKMEAKRHFAHRTSVEIVEHPFGTIKRSLGYTYFMQRGKDKVKGEFIFICFIYNLKRILNIFKVNYLIMALK
jgi:hypothetical protein